MTDAPPNAAPPTASETPILPVPAPQPKEDSLWARVRSGGQLLAAIALTVAFLVFLLVAPGGKSSDDDAPQPPKEIVQVVGPSLIQIDSSSTLHQKLQVVTATATRITSPILIVTGTVAASLRPGGDDNSVAWQFNSPETLTAYTEWQKAVADIAFLESQLARTKQLDAARVGSQKQVVERIKKLVDAGTQAPRDLATEQTNLLQLQMQGQKEIYEAESAVRVERRNEQALAQQLQQAGLDPELLRSSTADVDLLLADVPEAALSVLKIGQSCEARFFGLPENKFTGQVNSIAPALAAERRVLRALLVIRDTEDLLRPGMFADVGLGTDPRDALLIPAEALVHVGQADYVFVAQGDAWRVTEVQVGESHDGQLEVLRGLQPGDKIISAGAILLKPAIIRALRTPGAGATLSSPGPRT